MYQNPQEDFERLSAALDAGEIAWWEMELPSGVVFFSEKKALMLGRDPKDFVHYKSFTDILHPDDYPVAMKAMQDHLEGKASHYEVRYRIQCADGSYRTFLDRGKIVEKTAKKTKVAGIVIDITNLSVEL